MAKRKKYKAPQGRPPKPPGEKGITKSAFLYRRHVDDLEFMMEHLGEGEADVFQNSLSLRAESIRRSIARKAKASKKKTKKD